MSGNITFYLLDAIQTTFQISVNTEKLLSILIITTSFVILSP